MRIDTNPALDEFYHEAGKAFCLRCAHYLIEIGMVCDDLLPKNRDPFIGIFLGQRLNVLARPFAVLPIAVRRTRRQRKILCVHNSPNLRDRIRVKIFVVSKNGKILNDSLCNNQAIKRVFVMKRQALDSTAVLK